MIMNDVKISQITKNRGQLCMEKDIMKFEKIKIVVNIKRGL